MSSSLQARARDLRYRLFAIWRQSDSSIGWRLGNTADDQANGLLRMLRGAGCRSGWDCRIL